MIERLQLNNFTAFHHLDLHFSSGVNVLVGANGTGKTHLLKAIYGLLSEPSKISWGADGIPEAFTAAFLPRKGDLGRLQRNKNQPTQVTATVKKYGELTFDYPLLDGPQKFHHRNAAGTVTGKNVVFFPAKDIIGQARGLRAVLDVYELDIDLTYRDMLSVAFLPSRKSANKEFKNVLNKLQKLMGGSYPVVEEDQYYLREGEENIEISLVAEGWRKLAVLWHVLRNHPFLGPGDLLIWDEPEANLNPVALSGLVDCLADLSKTGLQIIIATHSYVLLRELEIRQARDLQFISLYRGKFGVEAHTARQYGDITPNLIEEENERLYHHEIGMQLEGER